VGKHFLSWRRGQQFESTLLRNAFGTFMGRDALSLAARLLRLKSEDLVLLPAFLCREVVKPFVGKARVDFYDVQPDLSVDPQIIETRSADARVRAVVIINYFGFLQPFRAEIREICSRKRIVLIEDCAHSLLSDGSGETGDLVIYSFRKLLPVPDGGALKINRLANSFIPRFYPRMYSNSLSLLIAAKLLLGVQTDSLSRAGLAARKNRLLRNRVVYGRPRRVLPLSAVSRYRIGRCSFSKIIERKRRDYEFWLEVNARTGQFTPLYPDLPAGVCPIGFPIRFRDRDSLKRCLLGNGIETQVHWHLPEIIGKEFTTSHEISAETLTLPIYPNLSHQRRKRIETLLRSGWNKL
jgi:perosamine synthetase